MTEGEPRRAEAVALLAVVFDADGRGVIPGIAVLACRPERWSVLANQRRHMAADNALVLARDACKHLFGCVLRGGGARRSGSADAPCDVRSRCRP